MKWLKSGPELKLPNLRDVRVPAFVEDLYYDLKDRRLLPIVALAIVAIIAVPFLLTGGSDGPEAGAAHAPGVTATASDANASLTVVRANPGLRDYRDRLHRKATDPFKQHFTAPQLAGTKLGAGSNGASSASGSTASSSSSTSTSTKIESTATSVTTKTVHESNGTVTGETETTKPQQQPGSGNGESKGEGNTGTEGEESRWFAFAIDVKVRTAITLPDGTVESGEPVKMTEVRSPAPIPTEKTPVVTYIGANFKTGKFALMVSEDVTSVFGEGKCLMGSQSCQLLEVEAGMPETFVYGPAGERFKITITNVKRVPIELPKNLEESAKNP